MNDWYKDWFAADEYLELYANRDFKEAKKLVDLILKFCDENNFEIKNVIDIACGFGRHALIFAQNGIQTFAFDLSYRFLQIATKLKEKSNINNLHFFCADVLRSPIKFKFDLATNLFTSFGYFLRDKDNFEVLKNIASLVKIDGLFVFDYFNSNFIKKNLTPYEEKFVNNKKFSITRTIINNRAIKEIAICINGKTKRYIESVKIYDTFEIKNMFNKLGLKIINIKGTYEGSDFDENSSERLIIFSKKIL